ncbi:MAG: hypothetical protein DMD62_14290 [Gemmatimonadetes bacterium]|nr:MAG: hypothetical protein DMD62_14290 [Gemmatimonadota bacterium]
MSVAVASRSDLVQRARQAPVARFTLFGAIAAIVGGIVLIMGLISGHPERAWAAYHVNFMFWAGLAQALVVFAATQKLAKGHWSGVIIRFAEAGVAFTTVTVVLFIGEIVGRNYIFTWIHEPRPDLAWWLTNKWFFLRNGAILVLLSWISWRFVRHDVAPDVRELTGGQPVDRLDNAPRISRDAAWVILAYAFGYTLIAIDLIMSLSTRWVSTLFGAFYFMGSFLAALMVLAILAIALRGAMPLEGIYTRRQQHDLAKLCFGFTVFWAYLMWSQFLVIWYGNLPEETYFIFYRLYGVWRPIGTAVFLMVFVIPFIGLLGVKPKLFAPTMVGFALVSLVGIWLERYLEIVPAINGGAGPVIGITEIGVTLFFAGLFILSWAWFAGRYPIISPRLAADALEREQH